MRRVGRTSPAWAFLAAVGAAYLVTGLSLVLREVALPYARELELALTNRTVYLAGLSEVVLLSLAIAGGVGVGAAVARRAGGGVAVLLFALPFAVEAAVTVANAFVREAAIRGSECCVVATAFDVPLAATLFFLPTAVAIAFGAFFVRARAMTAAPNAALEAAGAFACVGACGALVFGFPFANLVFAPFSAVLLDAAPHVLVAAAQLVVGAAVYALRRGAAAPRRVFFAFALMGFAGVAYADVTEIWFTLFLDHHYVPVSTVVVPIASALAALAIVLALRSITVATAPHPSGG